VVKFFNLQEIATLFFKLAGCMKNQILSGKQFKNTDEAALYYLKKTELLPKRKIALDFISPPARILDLGFGTGRTTVYFKKGIYL
jgi:hypothetical protein